MKIRKAIKNDIDAVYSLMCQLEECELDFDTFIAIYLDNLKDTNISYIVAEDNNEVIGFISVHIQKLLHHIGKAAEVQALIVHKDMRNKGIGKALLDGAKNFAQENDCVLIEVASNIKRERTHNFYTRHNMKKSHYKFRYYL